jgi:hypothetical protein
MNGKGGNDGLVQFEDRPYIDASCTGIAPLVLACDGFRVSRWPGDRRTYIWLEDMVAWYQAESRARTLTAIEEQCKAEVTRVLGEWAGSRRRAEVAADGSVPEEDFGAIDDADMAPLATGWSSLRWRAELLGGGPAAGVVGGILGGIAIDAAARSHPALPDDLRRRPDALGRLPTADEG